MTLVTALATRPAVRPAVSATFVVRSEFVFAPPSLPPGGSRSSSLRLWSRHARPPRPAPLGRPRRGAAPAPPRPPAPPLAAPPRPAAPPPPRPAAPPFFAAP